MQTRWHSAYGIELPRDELSYPFSVTSNSNQQFPMLPNGATAQLPEMEYEFEIDTPVDDDHTHIQLVTSWATSKNAITAFLADLAQCCRIRF